MTPHRRSLVSLALAAAALVAVPAAPAAAPVVPPAPTRYVTDGAGVLPPERVAALEQKLQEFERRTSTQVIVWIAPRVPEGTTMEELGADAIRAWGVGQAGKDNGAVLFLFTQDRKLRLATGYGLEGAIPDAVAKRILAERVRPRLAEGDFPGGVEAGVDAILAAAAGEGFTGTGRTVAERGPRGPRWSGRIVDGLGWIAALAFLVVGFRRRSILMGVLGLAGAIGGTIATIQLRGEPFWPLVPLIFLSPFVLAWGLAGFMDSRSSWATTRGSWRSSSSSDSSSSSIGSDGSSSSDSSSSSSSFSGGGGDSGGGGASDSF